MRLLFRIAAAHVRSNRDPHQGSRWNRSHRHFKPVFSSTVICAFVGTADDVAEIVGGAIYVYPDGEDCIVEVARATGQRELLGLDKSAAVRLLRMFAESVFRSSQGDNDPSDLALYVGAPVGPDLPVTVVRPGRLSHGIAPKAGGPVVSVRETQRWDSDWILRLFDPVAADPDRVDGG